eukprot:XP_001700542.1 predicted protein [Chlamydomonas reinhardtii]
MQLPTSALVPGACHKRPLSWGHQRVIANLVAYTGIVGTTAIVLAGFAGIDVWESFRWTNTNDLALAAALSVPLQAANAALLLPSFSALKLPHLADLKGHIISNNPTARINAGLEAAFAAVDTAAGEMLYRGVALTWLAAWLEDRIYEAGMTKASAKNALNGDSAKRGGGGVATTVAGCDTGRSSALAKELKAYNAEMQRILAKYTHKLPPLGARIHRRAVWIRVGVGIAQKGTPPRRPNHCVDSARCRMALWC